MGLTYIPPIDPRGQLAPGQVFCVNSRNGSDSGNHGKSWDRAMATVDAAVNLCTANTNDTILVAPEHTETITADSGIDIDQAGVSVIGLRNGKTMPTLVFQGAATADCKLAAAGVSIHNFKFHSNLDATTGVVEVSGTDCALIDCEYQDTTDTATDGIMLIDGADRCLIDGLRYFGGAAVGTNAAIAVDGADDLEIRNSYIYGNFAVGAIDFRTTASSRVNLHNLKIWTANSADIAVVDTITASTGFIGPNLQIMLTDDAANITTAVTGATFQFFDPIYICNAAGEKAMLTNITASTHA